MNEDLYFRLKVFISDLLNFKHERLSNLSVYYPEYFFSTFYFTEDEIEYLLMFPTSSGLTYKELFDEFIKSKDGASELCSSHKVAPVIYKIFKINKNFNKDKSFIKRYNKFKGLI